MASESFALPVTPSHLEFAQQLITKEYDSVKVEVESSFDKKPEGEISRAIAPARILSARWTFPELSLTVWHVSAGVPNATHAAPHGLNQEGKGQQENVSF